MYIDAIVIAGIATVLLMVGFLVAVGVFIMRDAKHKRHTGGSEAPRTADGKTV